MDKKRQKIFLALLSYQRKHYYKHNRFFSLTIKKLIKFFLRNFCMYFSIPEHSETDILFLHTYNGEQRRITPLVELLEKRGLRVNHDILGLKNAIFNRMFLPIDAKLHYELFLWASYAKYLIKKFQPKVLVTLEEGMIVSPFLKEEMHNISGLYANISHGVTAAHPGHSVIDFDYYFLFGKSSLDNLLQNNVRIGNPRVILSGSPFIDIKTFPKNKRTLKYSKNLLFFSSWLGKSESDFIVRNIIKLVIDWTKNNSEYNLHIKLHPLENPKFITTLCKGINNITILDQGVTIENALRDVPLVLNHWSTASLEAARLGRPTVVINNSGVESDFLDLEKFFLRRATNFNEINQNIKNILSNYEYFVEKAKEFYRYHIEIDDSITFIAEKLFDMYKNKKINPQLKVKEELKGLNILSF